MKRIASLLSALAALLLAASSFAQAPTAAVDFTVTDCSNVEHHLYPLLDKGDVVIMEFVMGCTPCVLGRAALGSMQSQFEAVTPGRVHLFTFGSSSGADCNYMQTWMDDNMFSGMVCAGDDSLIAHYGAKDGMPTICVVSGPLHNVIYWKKGFSKKDTTAIENAILSALTELSVSSESPTSQLQIFPNPASGAVKIASATGAEGEALVSIYNELGTLVKTINYAIGATPSVIDNSDLSAGSYLFKVTFNGTTETHRVVIGK